MVFEQFAQLAYVKIQPVIPELTYILILLIIAVIGIKVIDKLTRGMKKKFGDKMEFKVVSGLIQIVFLAVIIVIMLAQIGVSQDFLKFLGWIITGIIAFSSTTLIANLVSSVIIHITRPFYKGDIIKINDTVGKVIKVKAVYTEIYTFKKTRVEVPNATFIKDNIINYSEEGFRISVNVTLGYDVNRILAENTLLKAAKFMHLEDVFVAIIKLDTYFIEYELNGTSRESEGLPFIESQLNKTILDEFFKAKIEIASPMVVEHRNVGRLIPKTGRKEKRQLRMKEIEEKSTVKKLIKDTFEEQDKKNKKSKKSKKEKKKKQ